MKLDKKSTMTSINMKISKNLAETISLTHIKEIVSQETGISEALMEGKSRKREVIFARHLYCYIATHEFSNKLSVSLAIIGSLVNKDHASVLHAKKSMQDLIDTNKVIRARVYEIQRKCELKVRSKATGLKIFILTEYDKYRDNIGVTSIPLYAVIDEKIAIPYGEKLAIKTGIKIEVPNDMEAHVRSNIGDNEILNSGFHEIIIHIRNNSVSDYTIIPYQEIGHLLFLRRELVSLVDK